MTHPTTTSSPETNGLIDFNMDARAYLVALHADFMTRSGQIEALQPRLTAIANEKPEDLPEIIELLCSIPRKLPTDQADQLVDLIRLLPLDEGSEAAAMRDSQLEALAEFRTSSASYAAIQQRLREFVDENKPADWVEDPSAAAALVERLDALEDSSDPDAYFRLATSYLMKDPPGERFPFYLWRMGAWSEFAEGNGEGFFAKPALPLLLELCDQLPKTNNYYLEGRFLRAKTLAAAGETAAESEVYVDLLESGLLTSDAFLIAATFRLGSSLERQGKLGEARDRYLQLQRFTDRYAVANDALLNAALISLELDQRDQAVEILEQLAETGENILEASPHGRQIRSMTSLPDPQAYWAAGDMWWPAWEALRTQLLPGEVFESARVPAIGELPRFGTALRNAVRAKDASAFYSQFDLLLRALRWSPEFFNDCGSSATFLAQVISPESADDLRKFIITLCEAFPNPSADNLRRRQLYQALALLDSDRPGEALPISEAFFSSPSERDPIYFSMVRIRAIAASRTDGADLETPARALEEILGGSENDDSRVQNVLQLAQLYQLLKLPEKEEALLAREIEHPAIKADAANVARLRVRHQSLARDGDGAKMLTAAIAGWLADHEPGWLPSCPPLKLEDPRVGDDLERALRESGARFTEEESIKLALLVAASESISLQAREQAFASAFRPLLSDAATHAQARSMINAALDRDGFPKSLKQMVLFTGLDDAIAFRRADDIAFLLSHPALDRENERIAELAELYSSLADLDFDSAAELSKVIGDLSADGLKNIEIRAVLQCFGRLLELGELAAAEAVYKSSGQWRLDLDVQATNSEIKLGLLKQLKNARRTIAMNRHLHEALAPMLGLDEVGEPAWFSQRRHLGATPDLSMADTIALRLYQVKSKRFDQTNPLFWFDVADAIQSPDSAEFAFKLLEIYLAEADEDAARSRAAFLAAGIVDTDEPSVRQRLVKIFAPYRDLANAPLTRDAIRIFEIRSIKLRSGEAVDIDSEFASLTHPAAKRIHTRAKLTQLIQQGDAAALKQFLNQMPADRLLDETFLNLSIPALELAGLGDEAELARETAADKIPALITEGWRLPESNALADAYELAILLGDPRLVPGNALDDLLEHGLKNERSRLSLVMMRSRYQRDWPELEAAADEAIKRFPTFYSFYLEKARALYHQNRKKKRSPPCRPSSDTVPTTSNSAKHGRGGTRSRSDHPRLLRCSLERELPHDFSEDKFSTILADPPGFQHSAGNVHRVGFRHRHEGSSVDQNPPVPSDEERAVRVPNDKNLRIGAVDPQHLLGQARGAKPHLEDRDRPRRRPCLEQQGRQFPQEPRFRFRLPELHLPRNPLRDLKGRLEMVTVVRRVLLLDSCERIAGKMDVSAPW